MDWSEFRAIRKKRAHVGLQLFLCVNILKNRWMILYFSFEHNSSSSYIHFTIQTHIVTKYGAHVYIKREERKGKIDMNITVGG